MKRILVHGAGGAPALNFTRSLRASPEPFYLVGIDCDKYTLQRAETDERYLMPLASDPAFVDLYLHLLRKCRIDFVHVQPDPEIEIVSSLRDRLPARVFLPDRKVVNACLNKFESYRLWESAGLKVPRTVLLHSEEDLRAAFKDLCPPLWVRSIRGAAGRNSLKVTEFELARAWVDFHRGWGEFSAAECLRPDSVTWMSLWKDGDLVIAQGRKRLYWEFASRAPSGVTGVTGTGVTVSDPEVDRVAEAAVSAVDAHPNGIFSVDLTYDEEKVPNPTEINIGRFFTTHYFFTAAGLNMPYLYVRAAFGEPLPEIPRRMNPLPEGLLWIRGMDREPVLTTVEEVERFVEDLETRRRLHASKP